MDLLLVEDNSRISEFMVKGLQENNFSVTLAVNGVEARQLITSKEWSVIILDIMLPDIDGIELLQYTRFKKINTPILVVSALGDPEDKIKALNYGADDYLSKPFHFGELVARINALTRRSRSENTHTSTLLECKGIQLNVTEHLVYKEGALIHLTLQEFKLLQLLMENLDKVLSRTEIINSVWGLDYESNTNIVDVYISYLRNKIEDKSKTKIIETVQGRGYIIRSK
ncbi:response regulator transcription factor [Bacteroides coprosuis]|uniref:response regulator transcription factor n=1 Tax=Bacteroides coprosuis TaxID=151276 RepID=UPI001D7659FC|nr:response regulator transcription factor [Bacteroides coprosuis]HJD92004.1 response regulator transcription factor [Bacteroides coprosuis]